MNIKICRIIDSIINFFCRLFKVNFAVKYRKLTDEEVKALGLDKLEKEKPTEM